MEKNFGNNINGREETFEHNRIEARLTIDGLLRREMYERIFHRDTLADLYRQKAIEISSLSKSQVSKF